MDLIILCTLRTLVYSVFVLRDAYLLSNCCAVLNSAALVMTYIHPYTAERVVKVCCQLCRKVAKPIWPVTSPSTSSGPKKDRWMTLIRGVDDVYHDRRQVEEECDKATLERLLVPALSAVLQFVDTSLR